MVRFVGAEGMEQGEGVDVTTHMITHGLFIEAFTQSLYSWNVLALSKCTLYIIVFIQTMKLNNVQLV